MLSFFKSKIDKIYKSDKFNRNIFIIACGIYFFNSFGNVAQGVFIKYFMKYRINLNLYEFICFRCVIGIIVLIPFNLKNIKKYLTLSNKLFVSNIIISLFNALDIFLWNLGVQMIPVNSGVIIMLLIPIWITLLSRILLKEKDFSIFHLFSLLLGFAGVFISMNGQINNLQANKGSLIILINTFVVAIGLILQKKYKNERPVLYALFLNAVVGLLFFFILNFFTSFNKSVNIHNLTDYFFNKDLLFMLIIITIFDIMEYGAVYVAYSMYNVSSLQPVRFTRIAISAVLSYLFLNESITLYQFMAMTLVMFANIIIPLGKKIYLSKK